VKAAAATRERAATAQSAKGATSTHKARGHARPARHRAGFTG
jgi:hypothetical protein